MKSSHKNWSKILNVCIKIWMCLWPLKKHTKRGFVASINESRHLICIYTLLLALYRSLIFINFTGKRSKSYRNGFLLTNIRYKYHLKSVFLFIFCRCCCCSFVFLALKKCHRKKTPC